jgi:iron(III) transport system substrate-binding protein
MLILAGCGHNEVVIYTAVDQVFSEPVLRAFEQETGITVRALYDAEASKTVGLVNRLLAEKSNPQADVFWNSEVSRTIVLKNKGVLQQYQSPHWDAFPSSLKDSAHYWTGFSARARILIYNTNLVTAEQLPTSIFELVDTEWKGRVTIAYPLFGTTATHVAALYTTIGKDSTDKYLTALVANGIVVVDGNSVTRDLVADGKIAIGFTDTDDANVAIQQGKPVGVIYPDRDGIGTLVIPNTVALVAGCPNPSNGRRLIDYLLSAQTEKALAFSEAAQMPLRQGVDKPEHIPDIADVKAMGVDFGRVAGQIEETARFCQELFVR